jgi:hypothetical protein
VPTQNQAEEKFLKAMRDYVDFRILKGVDEPALQNADLLVSTFTEFLDSRPNAKAKEETVNFLVEKMVKMAESRGGTQPPPRPGDPPA